MTEPTTEQLATAAQEAQRLRTDVAFRDAVVAARQTASDTLVIAQTVLVEAVLQKQNTGLYEAEVIRLRARIEAIDGITTAIANAILRNPRETKPVT